MNLFIATVAPCTDPIHTQGPLELQRPLPRPSPRIGTVPRHSKGASGPMMERQGVAWATWKFYPVASHHVAAVENQGAYFNCFKPSVTLDFV